MKKKVCLLGTGLVGSAIAIDLHSQFDLIAADINQDALNALSQNHGIKTTHCDLSDKKALSDLIQSSDLIVCAVPGFMGYETVKTCIESKKDVVDISFMPEDFRNLDHLAKQNNVTIVNDCGVAPGMGNIILGYHDKQMMVTDYECLVGGLPTVREWPFEYKAVFSPIDVIEEYIRPARYIQNSQLIIKEALSDPEHIFFDGIGTLESWNSDGLRSLVDMNHIPNMIEKTLRYPGTIEYLRVLRDSGFFSYDEMEVNGNKIRPIDLTSKLLFPKWKLKPGEEDFTIMRIVIKGVQDGKPITYTYKLLDRFEKETNTISMARTTGYTCTAVVNLILDGYYNSPGINPPEYVGMKKDNFNYILKYLAERNVIYNIEITE